MRASLTLYLLLLSHQSPPISIREKLQSLKSIEIRILHFNLSSRSTSKTFLVRNQLLLLQWQRSSFFADVPCHAVTSY
ncbi:hypothetical protein Q3G72_008206 [Acer saccharum]|nr:hypothetical protein Q3G72_008206 [Acer saccharum]